MATTAAGFKTGQASVTVATADVPTSGTVTVSLVSQSTAAGGYDGVAGVDAFRVAASDWVGTQSRQLQYEFRYMSVSTSLCSNVHPLRQATSSLASALSDHGRILKPPSTPWTPQG